MVRSCPTVVEEAGAHTARMSVIGRVQFWGAPLIVASWVKDRWVLGHAQRQMAELPSW